MLDSTNSFCLSVCPCFDVDSQILHLEAWGIENEDYIVLYIPSYIWCVSKLGNIFTSPTGKKIFSRGRCAKCKIKICPWEILPQRNQKYLQDNVFLFLGCTPYAQSWVFFQYFQNTAFWWLYYSACKKATAMAFIW